MDKVLKQVPNISDLEKRKDKLTVNIADTQIRCKFCDSGKIVKYGHYKHVQYWWCKDCHHKFVNNKALPHMRYSSEEISLAARMFYGGISIKAIRETLLQEYNDYPSRSAVCNWIFVINHGLIDNAKNYHPQTGDIWKVYETAHKLNGRKYWIFDLIDMQTHFLLATVSSHRRNRNDIRILMKKAAERARKLPKQVVTGMPAEYLEDMELALGTNSGQIEIQSLIAAKEINFEKKWNQALKERAEVICDIREEKIAKLILEGWLIYYNYCRPLQPPDNQTPAKRAGIRMIPSVRGIPHSFLFTTDDAIRWI
jgi:transposase-like protein